MILLLREISMEINCNFFQKIRSRLYLSCFSVLTLPFLPTAGFKLDDWKQMSNQDFQDHSVQEASEYYPSFITNALHT